MISEEEVAKRMVRLAEHALAEHALAGPTAGGRPVESRPRRRPGRVLVPLAAVAALALVLAVAAAHISRPGGSTSVSMSSRLQQGVFSALPGAPIPPLGYSASAWTGSEWLIWGGVDGPVGPKETTPDVGAAYRPSTSTWTSLPPAPISGRQSAVSVWTGSEWIIAGGVGSNGAALTSAASFDPSLDRWSVLPPMPDAPGPDAAAVWTGKEMIVMTGYSPGPGVPTGGSGAAEAYNPATRRWTLLPTPPGNLIFGQVHLAWSGSKLYVLRSPAGVYLSVSFAANPPGKTIGSLPMGPIPNPVVAVFDPSTDTWATLPIPLPNQPYPVLAAYDGRLLVVAGPGGGSLLQVNDRQVLISAPKPYRQTESYSYDPASGAWEPLAGSVLTGTDLKPGEPYDYGGGQAVSTGTVLYFWSGAGYGSAFDAATDSWTVLPAGLDNQPYESVIGSVVAWTGKDLLAWGGQKLDPPPSGENPVVNGTPFSGASYRPEN